MLELNALKDSHPHHPVESFRFLGTILCQDFKWELNISSLTKKASYGSFYTAIESILPSSITIWCTFATAKDKSRLQLIIRTAEKVIGCNLPTLEGLHTSKTLRRARKIVSDSSQPGHTVSATPLRQKAAVHQDQNLTPHKQFLSSQLFVWREVLVLFNKAKDSH